MAQFLVNMMNHSLAGQRSLEDVVGIMGHQLRALGHRIVWDTNNNQLLTREVGINIIVEGFTPASVQIVREGHEKGARFIILATEEPTPRGFNHGWDPEMVYRQNTFPEAAKYADAIWHLVPGDHVTRWYSQHAPSAPVELGYADSLVRSRRLDFEPEYDFGFYGSLSKRRVQILRRLAKVAQKEKAIHVVGDFVSQIDRDREMRRAKVLVQIRKQDAMGLVSSSRCNTALCIGRPVVAEPHAQSGDSRWDSIIRFSKSLEKFYDDAVATRITWRGTHAKQFERFKAALSPEACVGAGLALVGLAPENAAPGRPRAAVVSEDPGPLHGLGADQVQRQQL